MNEHDLGVVIPVGSGRDENLDALLECLRAQRCRPAQIMVVRDGGDAPHPNLRPRELIWTAPKHRPGLEQPRNLGVRALSRLRRDLTHVWFLDSDLVFEPDLLEQLLKAYAQGSDRRILVAPYDWLPPHMRPHPGTWLPEHIHNVRNDPRWAQIDSHPPYDELVDDLAAGLACFSGNLIWPIGEFRRVGGFWSELHHGRCEDGELGLRAVAMGIPISFAAEGRAWHQWHPVDLSTIWQRNARDVPMIDARHPWLHNAGIEIGDRDGKSFEVTCPGCGERMFTNRWWQHAEDCGVAPAIPVA
jgi:GT2 family glycosyltransferase